MILPAAVAIASILKPILFTAVTGAAISGAADTVVSTVSDYHEHGEVTVEMVAENLVEAAPAARDGFIGGALISGAVLAAPAAIGAAGSAATSGIARAVPGAGDDLARLVSTAGDDLGKGIAGTSAGFATADDTGNALGRVWDEIGRGVNKATTSVGTAFNYVRNLVSNLDNARRFDQLPITLPKQGYVYVINDAAAGSTKIGITGNLPQRIKQLNSTVGRELNYVCIIRTATARAVETALHADFAAMRLPNTGVGTEWFTLSPAQVIQACSQPMS